MMKRLPGYAIWLPVGMVLASGCYAKQEEAGVPAGGEPEAAVEAAAEAAPSAAAERVARLGFVKHLPADTESVIAVYQGGGMLRRLQGSKLWKLFADQGVLGGLEELAGEGGEGEVTPAALFGAEFFIATGPGTGEQTANLLRLNDRSSHFQIRGLVATLAGQLAADGGDAEVPVDDTLRMFGDLLKDPESGIGLIERSSMPPLLLGFKVAGAVREDVAQELASMIEMIGSEEELAEPLTCERAGATFAGYRILGERLADILRVEAADGMAEFLDPASIERLLKAVASKNLVLLSGTLGDYVLVFLGSSADQFRLAGSVDESLGNSAGLAFMDEYAAKDVVAMVFGVEPLVRALSTGSSGLKGLAGGIREALAETNAFGDTRDIEALLQVVGEREDALLATMKHSALGLVAFLDDGLRIESIGGSGSPGAIDSATPHALAGLGEGDDVVLFYDTVGTRDYAEIGRSYVEAIAETCYAMAAKASTLEGIDQPEFQQFRDGFALFDGRLRPHVLKLWEVLSGPMAEGIGTEGALVVDFGGTLPAAAGIPQELVDEGVAPRVSYVCPVVDRAKLAESWRGIDAASRELLKVASELSGEEIPMQKPIPSEKGGFTTWYLSLPFITEDFMPSVTLDDHWFAASSSRTRALDLVGRIGKPAPQRSGTWLRVDFDALNRFATQWLALLDKHGAALFKDDPSMLDALRENRPLIEQALEASGDLDDLTLHGRYLDGRMRLGIHLKTR